MKIVRMNQLENSNGKLAAFFDAQTDDGIVIKGFRLVDGANGLFVAPPSEKGKDDKYYDTVILPQEIKNKLQETAIQEYNNK